MSLVVAVTGATGFIGGHVVTAWRREGTLVRSADLRAGGELAKVLDGAEIVVHAAAAPTEASRLVEACAVAGTRHIVHLSSISVFDRRGPAVLRDDATTHPSTSYGRAKLAEERAILEGAARTGIAVTVLRAPAVFGPNMRGRPLRLARWVMRGRPVPTRGGRRSVMYVENLAAATIAAATTNGTFVLDDGIVVTPDEFAIQLAAPLGRATPRLLRVPGGLARALRHVPLLGWAFEDFTVNGARFAETTGFRPPVAREIAFARTAAWLANEPLHGAGLPVHGVA